MTDDGYMEGKNIQYSTVLKWKRSGKSTEGEAEGGIHGDDSG